MQVVHAAAELGSLLSGKRRVAFVPTMGNLHAGHLALIHQARQVGGPVVASIFVNPLQFGAGEDFESYPRTLDTDCAQLQAAGTDIVFAPALAEMYPEPQAFQLLPTLTDELCGAHRPGHFQGVCTVVLKLFNLVQPRYAIFGKKDYQQHNPEFTMLEWYRAGTDYSGLMDECEEMLLYISKKLGLGEEFTYQGSSIDLRRPWQKISVTEAFERYASLSVEDAIQRDCFDQVMVEKIEPNLGRPKPTFLYDYPSSLAALARIKSGNSGVAERFELYIAGIELANAFSELTDAREQALRFQKEIQRREQLGKIAYPLPEKFLRALPSMPESAGIAFGVDRLVMLFCNQTTIDAVVAFTPEEL